MDLQNGDRADVFRAVGVYSSAVLSGCKDGKTPIAYCGAHGVDDPSPKTRYLDPI